MKKGRKNWSVSFVLRGTHNPAMRPTGIIGPVPLKDPAPFHDMKVTVEIRTPIGPDLRPTYVGPILRRKRR